MRHVFILLAAAALCGCATNRERYLQAPGYAPPKAALPLPAHPPQTAEPWTAPKGAILGPPAAAPESHTAPADLPPEPRPAPKPAPRQFFTRPDLVA